MRRALATSTLACGMGAIVVAVSTGADAALETLGLLLAVSAAALAAGLQGTRSRRRVGSIVRQLALAVRIAVGAILAAVWLAAGVMFISGEDALLVSVMAAVIAVVGVCVARLLTDPMVQDIERLRDRLRAVGVGDRRTNLVTGSNDELAELAAEANGMISRLAEEEAGRTAAEDARQRLIIAVSHDLRTPLASLRLLAGAIEDDLATGATRARYLREMQTHVTALSALIDDLFDLCRLQAGEISLTIERVKVGELVSETVAAMRAAGETRGVILHAEAAPVRAPGEALLAEADRERIRRVLLNLLDNAIRHTPAGGNVVVRTSRRAADVEVEVADEGSGIAPEQREQVFETFFRGSANAARSGDGAGLGLAISRAIVEAHGGRIWLEDASPGTRVRFTLAAALRAVTPGAAEGRAGAVSLARPSAP